jgi:hypothetical protein
LHKTKLSIVLLRHLETIIKILAKNFIICMSILTRSQRLKIKEKELLNPTMAEEIPFYTRNQNDIVDIMD